MGAIKPRKKFPEGYKVVSREETLPCTWPRIKILANHHHTHSPSLKRTVTHEIVLVPRMRMRKKMLRVVDQKMSIPNIGGQRIIRRRRVSPLIPSGNIKSSTTC